MFSAAEPSIEATNAMGALGALQQFRGPCFNGHQVLLTSILCVCLSLADRLERGEIPVQIKQNVFISQRAWAGFKKKKPRRKTVGDVEGVLLAPSGRGARGRRSGR